VDRSIMQQHWFRNVMQYETLFLSIYLLDKYLEKKGAFVDEHRLNLLSVTALYTAGKYEDIWPPKLDTLLGSIQPQPFMSQVVKQFEIELLTTINFELNVPTPMRFLEFFLWGLRLEKCKDTLDFCCFLLDMMLLETYY
jgi:hypothetical protein